MDSGAGSGATAPASRARLGGSTRARGSGRCRCTAGTGTGKEAAVQELEKHKGWCRKVSEAAGGAGAGDTRRTELFTTRVHVWRVQKEHILGKLRS